MIELIYNITKTTFYINDWDKLSSKPLGNKSKQDPGRIVFEISGNIPHSVSEWESFSSKISQDQTRYSDLHASLLFEIYVHLIFIYDNIIILYFY
jgi:hypothetical protein